MISYKRWSLKSLIAFLSIFKDIVLILNIKDNNGGELLLTANSPKYKQQEDSAVYQKC